MRITSTISLLIADLLLATSACATKPGMALCIPDADCINLKTSGRQIAADTNNKAIPLDGQSQTLLANADEVVVASTFPITVGNVHTAITVIRKPSTKGPADGFCGAGHEDYLALFGVDGGTLKLYDKVLVQSCLKSISLVADEGDDPKVAIKSSTASSSLSYAAIVPPDFELKNFTVRVQDGKLLVEEQTAPGK